MEYILLGLWILVVENFQINLKNPSWHFAANYILKQNWIQLSTPSQNLWITSYLLTHRVENFCTQIHPKWVHWGVFKGKRKQGYRSKQSIASINALENGVLVNEDTTKMKQILSEVDNYFYTSLGAFKGRNVSPTLFVNYDGTTSRGKAQKQRLSSLISWLT